MTYLRSLEKQEQTKPNSVDTKKLIKTRADIKQEEE